MERKLRRLQKELEIEARLKSEAKRDRDDCQKEIDELLVDNENFRRRLKQCQGELEKIQNEHKELMDDLHNSAVKGSEAFGKKLSEAEVSFEKRLNEERAKLTRDIKKYRKQCEVLESKCQNSEQRLQVAMCELGEMRDQLGNAETYRQQDIDRLLEEKESLKVKLKVNKGSLQSLESSNDELACKLNDKERELRRLEKLNSLNQKDDCRKYAYGGLEGRCIDESTNVDELGGKVANVEPFLEETINEKNQERNDKCEVDMEVIHLKCRLGNLEKEKLLAEQAMNDLRAKNADLQERSEKAKLEKQELQVVLNENIKENKSSTRTIAELDAKINAKEKQINKLKEVNQKLRNNIEKRKLKDESKCDESGEALEKCGMNSKSATAYSAVEEERKEVKKNDKELAQMLEITEKKLREKEDLLCDTEMSIAELAKKNKQLEKTVSTLQKSLIDFRKSLNSRDIECKNLSANQYDLLNQMNEKERKCEETEQKLKEAEKKQVTFKNDIQASSEMASKLEHENHILRKELQKAIATGNEKQSEIMLLEKKIENYLELSEIVKQRENEVQASKRCMEETARENCKLIEELKVFKRNAARLESTNKCIEEMEKENYELITEARHLKVIIHDLETKVEMLENEIETVKQEKEGIEKELEESNKKLKSIRCSEKDVLKIYENLKFLEDDNQAMKENCNELQKIVNESGSSIDAKR